MDMTYGYTAARRNGEVVQGLVDAPNSEQAMARVLELGLEPAEVVLRVSDTINSLASSQFNQRELKRLYRTLGRSLNRGRDIRQTFAQAQEFVTDPRLKTAISGAKARLDNGVKLGRALQESKFPERHAAAIEALEQAGKMGDAFIALSEEVEREQAMRKEFKSMMRTPMVMGVMIFVVVYLFFGLILPKAFGKMIANIGFNKLPMYAQHIFSIAFWVGSHLVISTIVWLIVGIALVLVIRSRFVRGLIDYVPAMKLLSERSDMAVLWRAYATLYDTGNVPPASAARTVSRSAKREDSRDRFEAMAEALDQGKSLGVAVRDAEFPDYVVKAVGSAAAEQGSMVEPLLEFSGDLFEQVEMLTEQLQAVVKNAVTIGSGVLVLGLFFVTYFPILSTIMSQL